MKLVSIEVDECTMKRVLMENGASKDIFFYRCFFEMELNSSYLESTSCQLKVFVISCFTSISEISVQRYIRMSIDTHSQLGISLWV